MFEFLKEHKCIKRVRLCSNNQYSTICTHLFIKCQFTMLIGKFVPIFFFVIFYNTGQCLRNRGPVFDVSWVTAAAMVLSPASLETQSGLEATAPQKTHFRLLRILDCIHCSALKSYGTHREVNRASFLGQLWGIWTVHTASRTKGHKHGSAPIAVFLQPCK